MTYRDKEEKMGITISIKAYRKSRGKPGCGRGKSTGKKAEITQEGKDLVTIRESSFTVLCREIRKQFPAIPSGVKINSSGVTHL